jgi:hypothetical protein
MTNQSELMSRARSEYLRLTERGKARVMVFKIAGGRSLPRGRLRESLNSNTAPVMESKTSYFSSAMPEQLNPLIRRPRSISSERHLGPSPNL